jgi:hypothetical protein
MEGPISFWGYKEQESNLILPEHDGDVDEGNLIIGSGLDRLTGLFAGLIALFVKEFQEVLLLW